MKVIKVMALLTIGVVAMAGCSSGPKPMTVREQVCQDKNIERMTLAAAMADGYKAGVDDFPSTIEWLSRQPPTAAVRFNLVEIANTLVKAGELEKAIAIACIKD